MGIRINKAIGYGMDAKTFELHCPIIKTLSMIDNANKYYDIHDHLSKITKIDRPSLGEFSKYCLNEYQRIHFDIMANYTVNPKVRANELLREIGYDFPEYYLLIPSLAYSSWYRRDDAIDYTQHKLQISENLDSEVMKTNVQYLDNGHYPYNGSYIDINGQLINYDKIRLNKYRNKKTIEYIPEPPPEICYWAQKLGVLDREGILKLRPMIATWWN